MAGSEDGSPKTGAATRIVRAGRPKDITGPFINPPVVHASTVLFDNTEAMLSRRQRYQYGRRGTPTSDALEMAVSELEGAAGTVLCPSGLSAVSTALLASLSSGDRLLLVDSVYGPVRHFADTVLKRFGVTVVYYDPAIAPAGLAALMEERTAAVYFESPGSLTFEMQDIPALAAVAKERGAVILADNTWATPFYFKPLAHGVDLSIQAGTKYFGGHADVNFGTVAANAEFFPRLKEAHGTMGMCLGPDDIFLGLRGIRTLAVRLDHQMRSGLAVAEWLSQRPEVSRILHPALPSDPGHAIWRRDMKGACGLFGVMFDHWSDAQAMRFVDSLKLFGIGASWGGFESLAILSRPQHIRSARPWTYKGQLVRLHIGLEDPADLIADLEQAFAVVAAAL
jgi:cysteine-S-conjugate beta-lyase